MKRRDIELMLNEHGMSILSLVQNSHWKARVRLPDGRERIVTFPTSTSDHRALKNKSAQLRNMLAGVA